MSWSSTAAALPLARRVERAVLPELVGGRPGLRPRGGVEGDEEGGRRRAHQIVRAAEREAQELVAAGRAQAEERAQAGYREGLLQGRAEGLLEAREELRGLAAALAQGVAQARDLETDLRGAATTAVVSLATALAERIVRGIAVAEPEMIVRVVQAALAALPAPGEITVRVHPTQHATLQRNRDDLLAAPDPSEGVGVLRCLADPAITPGGCRVETPGCLVDATVEGQLEEACRRLRGEAE